MPPDLGVTNRWSDEFRRCYVRLRLDDSIDLYQSSGEDIERLSCQLGHGMVMDPKSEMRSFALVS